MIIVLGHLTIRAGEREAYLEDCRSVVELGRAAPGCLDFVLAPDLLDPDRVNVAERWESREALEAFRGSGPSEGQWDAIVSADVGDFEVSAPSPAAGGRA